MMKNKIEFFKFDSNTLSQTTNYTTELPTLIKDIELSALGLSYYTAKAMLTRATKFTPAVRGYALSYFSIIPCLLTKNNGYWAIEKNNKDLLRDFSKTARIGEIAQGISYYVSVRELGALSVWDYNEFFKQRKIVLPPKPGRLPDYVLSYGDKTYGVLESKGTMDNDPTPRIKDANKQCVNGKSILVNKSVPVKNSFATAVSFSTNSPSINRNTRIYVVDPEEEVFQKESIDYKAEVIHECSKHLCLAGDLNAANAFAKVYAENHMGEYSLSDFEKTGSFKVIDDEDKVHTYEMGFSEKLIKYLKLDSNEPFRIEPLIDGDTEFFHDGTYIKRVE